MRADVAEQKEYTDIAVDMMEQAQKKFWKCESIQIIKKELVRVLFGIS